MARGSQDIASSSVYLVALNKTVSPEGVWYDSSGCEVREVVGSIAAIARRMLRQNGFVPHFQFHRPDAVVPFWNVAPGAAVAGATVIGSVVRQGGFNRRADSFRIIR
jgi:hypothetical protein